MRALSVPAAAVACLVLAAGCAGKDDEPGTAPAPSPSVSTRASEPSEPSGSPSSSTAEPTPAADAPLVDRLLPTELVPGLNARWTWQDGETGPAGADPFGLCANVDLGSIGADAAYERSYFPPDDSDDNAAEQVVEFPDDATAGRAWAVLASWHHKCASKRAANPGLRVSRLAPVPVPSGNGRHYLLSWTPAGEEVGRFEQFGMVRNGTRIAVLRMDSSSQDFDYPPGQEPMLAMVRAAADRLG